jgi:hypothetical protein
MFRQLTFLHRVQCTRGRTSLPRVCKVCKEEVSDLALFIEAVGKRAREGYVPDMDEESV